MTVSTTTSKLVPENYSPILSEHDTGYYRVLMEQWNDTYTIHTGDNLTRILREFELPKEIRVKLAMIKAYEKKTDNEMEGKPYQYSLAMWTPMEMYMNSFPSEFSDIGWRCKPDPFLERQFYCVVTTAETLDLLRGRGT